MKVGSEASLIDWGAIGAPGRDFILSGPDAEAISAFTGREALDPIRVYVGRANADTPRERAELALSELQRLGAFEREVLIIASPTGTGWMDPGAHDPVEYMHGGDIATVAAQYSYLQSPLALILETGTGLAQATALQEAVHGYWKTLPEEARPRLYVHGLTADDHAQDARDLAAWAIFDEALAEPSHTFDDIAYRAMLLGWAARREADEAVRQMAARRTRA